MNTSRGLISEKDISEENDSPERIFEHLKTQKSLRPGLSKMVAATNFNVEKHGYFQFKPSKSVSKAESI
jgi:hypothetical protein